MYNDLVIYYGVGIATAFIAAGIAYRLSSGLQKTIPKWILYILIGLSTYVFIAQYLKFQSLHMYADFSHWAQIVKNISTSWFPESLSVEFIFPGTKNYFAVHFTPFIYIFAPAFKLIPSPHTLLILQGIFMFSAIIPLYLLARKIQQSRIFALFTVTLLVWYPTFQYITLYEFEMLRFSIPLLLWMIYFWEKRYLPLYFLFVFLAVLVREEVGLTIFMFGLYLFFAKKEKIKGLVTSIIGISAFFIIIKVIIPLFNNLQGAAYLPLSLFAKFGNTPLGIIQGVLTQPGLLFSTIFNPIKLANISMLFIPLLLTPLAAPLIFISTLANLGTGLLSNEVEHTSYMLYYIAPSVPFIFYALLKAWPKITVRFNAQAVMSAMFVGIIVSNIFFGPSPISLQFWFKDLRPAPFRTQNFHWSVYRVTDHHRLVDKFVRFIPDDAIVSAEQFLAPQLFKKKGTMIFPQLETGDGKYKADYVFIDKTNPVKTGIATVPGSWDGLRENPQYYYDWVEKDPQQWQLIKADDGYYLYQRKMP